MNIIASSIIASGRRGATVLALVILLLMAVGGGAVAQQRFQQVQVINADTDPMPVDGTVNVGNVPTVNVGNVPSVNVGNLPSVQNVTGTVDVTATSPLPVSVQDTAIRDPLTLTGERMIQTFGHNGCSGFRLPLPDDSLMRLESISVTVHTSRANRPRAQLTMNILGPTIAIPLTTETGLQYGGGTLQLGGILVDSRTDAPEGAIKFVTLCASPGASTEQEQLTYVVTGERIG